MNTTRKICDPHVHIYPHKALRSLLQALYGDHGFKIPASYLRGLPEKFAAKDYLQHAEPHGVQLAVNLPVANKSENAVGVAAINDWCLEQQEESKGKLVSLGAINPRAMSEPEIKAELDRIVESQLISGIKLIPMTGPAFQEFDPADERLEPLYKAVADRDMLIVWHMGSRRNDNNVATVQKIAAIHERYGMRMVAAHLGNDQWEIVAQHLAKFAGVAFDLAYNYPMDIDYSHIIQINGAILRQAIRDVGQERIFAGFDFPHMSVPVGVEAFDHLAAEAGLTTEQKQAILWDSPVRFYGLAA